MSPVLLVNLHQNLPVVFYFSPEFSLIGLMIAFRYVYTLSLINTIKYSLMAWYSQYDKQN